MRQRCLQQRASRLPKRQWQAVEGWSGGSKRKVLVGKAAERSLLRDDLRSITEQARREAMQGLLVGSCWESEHAELYFVPKPSDGQSYEGLLARLSRSVGFPDTPDAVLWRRKAGSCPGLRSLRRCGLCLSLHPNLQQGCNTPKSAVSAVPAVGPAASACLYLRAEPAAECGNTHQSTPTGCRRKRASPGRRSRQALRPSRNSSIFAGHGTMHSLAGCIAASTCPHAAGSAAAGRLGCPCLSAAADAVSGPRAAAPGRR